jgi:hypothetical protein
VNKLRLGLLIAKIRMGALGAILSLLLVALTLAQAVPYARSYQKSREEVDAALKELQAYSGQKLPVVDGFVATTDKPLDQYERAFYQFAIELLPGTSSGTIVRITAKITAWYADKDPSKSGYQVLPSNGRLELDLLDRLEEKFGGKPAPPAARSVSNSTITAPKPKLDLAGVPGAAIPSPANPPANSGAAKNDELGSLRQQREAEEKRMRNLSAELQSLQEIQKNQAHPLNLVVVKKSGTPVLVKPAEGAHVLFNAAAEDEFEFLDLAGDWIHVQISGISRGYMRRNSLALPEALEARLQASAGRLQKERLAVFRIVREETTSFPGDWDPLRGKSVKIYTVQPISQDPKEIGAGAKLSFAASLFEKGSAELTSTSPTVEGIVIIFDSADGGIVGATLASVQQLASHSILLENFWRQCYLDPPEAFQVSAKP